jgi:ABC-type bacteriocin/lantibiotic exporter with double-glycine peptidase domain
MMPAVPVLVRFVRQTGFHGDCGVSTLAMLAGVLYEDALAVAARIQPAVLQMGLTWDEMQAASKRLGLKTRLLRAYDIEEVTGVLNVTHRRKKDNDHYVFLWEGRIVDGNGEMWREPSDYLKHYNYRARWLLVAED